MKKMTIKQMAALILICVLLLVSSCGKGESGEKKVSSDDRAEVSSEEASSAEEHGYRLLADDYTVNGIRLRMTPDEVTAVLGDPDRQSKGSGNGIHGGYISMDYPGMTLWFEEYPDTKEFLLDDIFITGEDIKTVNGVHVGCTLEEVIPLFDHPSNDVIRYAKTVTYSVPLYNSCDFQPYGFNPDWPDEPIFFGYYSDYKESSDPIHYQYFDQPVWNEDKTEMTISKYDMAMCVTPGNDTVTEIVISFNCETLKNE